MSQNPKKPVKMKIGIFDSGLGGLIITREIRKLMPNYDYVYLGDTKRVPYGDRSHTLVAKFTKQGVDYLFKKEKCALVVIACNTASARALREIQQGYLLKEFKNSHVPRRVLGVLIPAAEEAATYAKIGVLATVGTVKSDTFPIEISKLNPKAKVFQNSASELVPLIEAGKNELANPYLKKYLQPLLDKNIEALILGCTHYPILKKNIRALLPKKIKIIAQDEIIPKKLKSYLRGHKEIEGQLSKNGKIKILTTKKTPNMSKLVGEWFSKRGKDVGNQNLKILSATL